MVTSCFWLWHLYKFQYEQQVCTWLILKILIFWCIYCVLDSAFDDVKVKVLVGQLSPTSCCPMNCSLPGSSVHGILQVRILQWVATSFSRGSFQIRDRTHVSYVSCIGKQVFTIWVGIYYFLMLYPKWHRQKDTKLCRNRRGGCGED